MAHYESVDPAVSFQKQIRSDYSGPVTLVVMDVFESASDLTKFMEGWSVHAKFMRSQPGFISAQVHRGFGGANVLLTYAVWESLAAFRSAGQSEERAEKDQSDSEASSEKPPGYVVGRRVLLQKIAIPGLCVA
jgi:heme-degrading monooxygenase HmoA